MIRTLRRPAETTQLTSLSTTLLITSAIITPSKSRTSTQSREPQ